MRTMVHSLTELAVRYGEDTIQNYLRTFSCPPNSEVEQFLRDKALTSAKLSTSQTYLVVDEATNILLGYYTLVLKSFSVKGSQLSSNNRRQISRFAEEDAGLFVQMRHAGYLESRGLGAFRPGKTRRTMR